MALAPGTWLNHYEILAPIGAGGMGEVYRARDNKLQREVALKVLPEAFAQDPERVARFRREAQVLAQLNHPNIAAIYSVEQAGETHFLVMELAPGETLREKIREQGTGNREQKGGIPIEEALDIAKQIAAGLECAHEKPIVHRDLKPANVKVTPEGVVKILDFGLARAFSGDSGSSDPSDSPTLSAMTAPGTILGTAAYMSPEQARGKKVDKRTDIWALGCVLYEMLTGKHAFAGEDVTDILASVVKSEPDWTALPEATPPGIRTLLQRCLQKDRDRRLRDAGDAQIEIEQALREPEPAAPAAAPVPVATTRRQVAAWSAVASIVVAAIASVATWNFMRPTPPLPVRLTAVHSGSEVVGNSLDPDVAISPDGRSVVYHAGTGSGGIGSLYIRSLDQLEPTLLADPGRGPFFSPDGQWVGFFDGETRTLMKVARSGGPAVLIARVGDNPRGATWGLDDTIVFATQTLDRGLLRVSAGGGEPEILTTPNAANGEAAHVLPEFLPDGRGVLFTIGYYGSPDLQIALLDLETGAYSVLIQGGSNPHYASSGHIIYGVAGTLRAVAFDLDTLTVSGTPVPVLEGVATKTTGAASFSLSRDGTLTYLSGEGSADLERTLVWVDRQGTVETLPAPPRSYVQPRLSPDGQQVALWTDEGDVWVYSISRGTLTRLTFEGLNSQPVWTPDGSRIVFRSDREGPMNLFWRSADGSGPVERLTTSENVQVAESWSSDGRVLSFSEGDPNRGTGSDMWMLPLEGERQPRLFLQTPFMEGAAVFSPDGQWLAYVSNESGRREVFVQPFGGPGGKWQISTEGGSEPVWARDGKELFYRNGSQMMAVDITSTPAFRGGTPRLLFEGEFDERPRPRANYDVSPDGQRFLMVQVGGPDVARRQQIHVVLHWFEELGRRVPAAQ